ncbi:MAG: molybdopterin-binding protein, partial [Anaerolineaceae bacterium]|nr:molybdopterin-binding protein [Anaerolineaceae bacterium]
MPVAEIIAIGTELLLGETQDTNTSRVARFLRNQGIDVYRATIVGDNAERIASAIQESLQRAQIVITTGGLGPTVDDATRQAAALAFKVETEFHPSLWEQILERFRRYGRQPTENNRRQAYLPRGAVGIPNPVGTAPAFYIERSEKLIICLPGVPREMETLLNTAALPLLKRKYEIHGVIKAHTLHASGVGESVIDELISDLETGSNPTVGLSAHAGQIDIRITVKAASAEEADRALTALSTEIQKRLGEHIYGANGDTLEGVITARLAQRGWKLVVIEWGLDGALAERLKNSPSRLAASDQTPD